ncbi:ATP-binding protein [Ammoniphilus sp. CFH 90114]|uniref:ATP-binding protein n=1 Tax=Ammoniphilus sp. CFH 90114 TaxID=2493665 RepID=UPI00100DEDD4|nr:ATP-binding protein [Ammoniphilus sp. CFH 90114]RXT02880.1 PAS domain S-box protein [Ammoniphilus sp. CFH 90114]
MNKTNSKPAVTSLKVPLLYLIISMGWIFFSGKVLVKYGYDSERFSVVHSVVELIFVITTVCLLYFLIYRQIKTERRAKELWQEREEQLRYLIDTIPDFVCYKDAKGRWVEANAFAIQLFQLENVAYKGKTDKDLAELGGYYQEAFLYCYGCDQEALKSSHPVRAEEVIALPDGGRLTFDVLRVPTSFLDGSRKGLIVIGRNITEWKQAEDMLRKSDRLSIVGQLAAGVAHEIRNPLATLTGFVQLLKEQAKENTHYYEIMLSELDRINFIVSEFMMLAKPQVLHFEKKDLTTILHHVVTLANTQAIMNNVEIKTNIPDELPPIYCEENQLKQVFINIMKNSIESMSKGGDITIDVSQPDPDHVLLRFTDEGGGIPEERLARLGEPFYSTKEKGMGLGLMVSYRIIEAHKGTIRITSKVGKGTSVEVVLPRELGE